MTLTRSCRSPSIFGKNSGVGAQKNGRLDSHKRVPVMVEGDAHSITDEGIVRPHAGRQPDV